MSTVLDQEVAVSTDDTLSKEPKYLMLVDFMTLNMQLPSLLQFCREGVGVGRGKTFQDFGEHRFQACTMHLPLVLR